MILHIASVNLVPIVKDSLGYFLLITLEFLNNILKMLVSHSGVRIAIADVTTLLRRVGMRLTYAGRGNSWWNFHIKNN